MLVARKLQRSGQEAEPLLFSPIMTSVIVAVSVCKMSL